MLSSLKLKPKFVINSIDEKTLCQAKQHLENCLKNTQEGNFQAQRQEYYRELADREGISYAQIGERLGELISKLNKTVILAKVFQSTYPQHIDFTTSIELCIALTDIVKNYWIYLPPTLELKHKFVKIVEKRISKANKTTQKNAPTLQPFKSIKMFVDLFIESFRLRKSPLRLIDEYLSSYDGLLRSILKQIEEEKEIEEDWREFCEAKERSAREGTINWDDLKSELGF
ncbi:hypothetical protein [Gloeothece verrucosa]|uniref:Uncharacterized protein n=1 Tax=Gloeothece verrucosa (strain PCC 7822) TaxID=497965 RepID=E0UNC7_GLOV7|nr:hypothetical protein [Gloeothece verrucosa]ADN18457.1 hypothetical protein Cyan7822_6803 [Gloeothece verrucosa PCC 7822]